MNEKNKIDELDFLSDAMAVGVTMVHNIAHIDSFKNVNENVVTSRTAAGWLYSEFSKGREIEENKMLDKYVESAKGYESEEQYLKDYPFPEFCSVLGKELYRECKKYFGTIGGKSVFKEISLITEEITEAYMKATVICIPFDLQVNKRTVESFLSVKQFFDTEEEFLSFLQEHSFENRAKKHQALKTSSSTENKDEK